MTGERCRPSHRAAPKTGAGCERGAGTVLALALVAAVAALFVAIVPLAAVTEARQRASHAADAAALAAADVRIGVLPGESCPAAELVAVAHGARMMRCVLDGEVATVEAAVESVAGTVVARASAGPPTPALSSG